MDMMEDFWFERRNQKHKQLIIIKGDIFVLAEEYLSSISSSSSPLLRSTAIYTRNLYSGVFLSSREAK